MLALVDQPTDETTIMPAPEDRNVQTPGEQPAAVTESVTADPTNDQTEDQAKQGDSGFALGGPAFSAKHNGGGRWKIWFAPTEGAADWFGDFVATGKGAKELAEAEAERLNAGGEPGVAAAAPAKQPAAVKAPAARRLDPSQLKAPVMTPDGWLCPEPKPEA